MKNRALFTVTLAVISLVACSKTGAEPAVYTTTVTADDDIGTQSALAQRTGQSVANLAAASDMFETETSNLAAQNGGPGKVKAFAAKMVRARAASSEKLTEAAGKGAPPIIPAPVATIVQQTQLDEIRAKSGTLFDNAYARAQVSAHQAKLDVLKGQAAGGDQPFLKRLASDLIPAVAAQLNMAKAR